MILAGDIGGTNTRLAIFERQNGALQPVAQTDFTNRSYPRFEDLLADFMRAQKADVSLASLAVAGPVVNNVVTGTNLPWAVDAVSIARSSHLQTVELLNDLLALAHGLMELPAKDVEILQAGEEEPEGTCAVVAAGTGLGEAGLLRNQGEVHPFPSEGGHSDFAPVDELQMKLLAYLLRRYPHVSYERVLSGMGTVNIYEFLRDESVESEPPELRDELAAAPDKASVISRHGLEGNHAICVRALNILAAIFAAEAGNVALRMFATGGVFLGGGIAPKIAPVLRTQSFRDAFSNKGRMQKFMSRIPIKLVLNQHTGLIGAAAFGFKRAQRAENAAV